MALTARVLIVARDDALVESLAIGLDRLGWPSVIARGLHSALVVLEDLPVEAVIVMLDDEASAQSIATRLKAQWAPRQLPVLALGGPPAAGELHAAFDLTLSMPIDAAQAAKRLEQLVRAAVAEEELELRRQTFAERGRKLDLPVIDTAPLRILTIGEPAPKFLALSHALKQSGAEVTGAFTAYTAFDYLHDRNFDAVVLWGGDGQIEALSIAVGMRRNTRLYHLPTLLYLRTASEVDLPDAFRRGLSDVAAADAPEAETALRVVSLARAYRRETAIRNALEKVRGSGLMDSASGLFTRELFAAHLARLAQASGTRRRPLSVAVLRIAERPEIARLRAGGWLDRALPQIGSMVGRLIRAEDTAARIAPDVFALALPGANANAARSAAERIAAVIACTAFQAAEGQPAFTVEFEIGSAELRPGESAARALELAAAQSMARKAG
ncbi:MAG: diguanylate cyclase domain-containing protein [Caulobacteraceae bacterium]